MESPDQRRNRNSCGPGTLRPTRRDRSASMESPDQRRNRNSRGPGTLRPTRRDRSVSMESPDQRRNRTAGTDMPVPESYDRMAAPGTAATEMPRPRDHAPGRPLPLAPAPPQNGRNGVRSRTKPVEGEPRGRSDRPEREKTENRSDFFRFGGTEFVHLFLILPQHPDKPRAYSVS